MAFQAENCETPVSSDNLLRDFLGLRSNVCPISSSFSSVKHMSSLGFPIENRTRFSESVYKFTNCISVRRTDIGESVSK